MPDETLISSEVPSCPEPLDETESKRARWFEVSLVILVIFGASILNSFYLLGRGSGQLPFHQSGGWSISFFQEATGLLLVGYVLSRRKHRFKDLGLRWSVRDLGVGLLVAIVSYVSYGIGLSLVHQLQHVFQLSAMSGFTAREMFGHPPLMAVPFILLNPFFEELIVRAYLMTEVRDLTGSWPLAAAVSVVVQASYHLYYGVAATIALAFQFVIFAIYYARTRKATPIIVAHGLFDILGFVRLW
jgi:membrane protease YdiL (CAAX protease family)